MYFDSCGNDGEHFRLCHPCFSLYILPSWWVALKPGTWKAGTENLERRNRKPGTWNAGTENTERLNAGTENPERRNGETENPERRNRNPGTPEQKTRNRKPGTHF